MVVAGAEADILPTQTAPKHVKNASVTKDKLERKTSVCRSFGPCYLRCKSRDSRVESRENAIWPLDRWRMLVVEGAPWERAQCGRVQMAGHLARGAVGIWTVILQVPMPISTGGCQKSTGNEPLDFGAQEGRGTPYDCQSRPSGDGEDGLGMHPRFLPAEYL